MYIDLTRLSDDRKEFNETIQFDLEDESARLLEPCRIWGELKKRIVQVDVEGKISAKIQMDCSRCIRIVNSLIEVDYKASYITQENYTKEKERELHGEDLEISIYDGDKIDLTDLAREQILLNLPTQIFCVEDCKGLCPKCSANLNEKNCNCETKEIDPRWAKLNNLK